MMSNTIELTYLTLIVSIVGIFSGLLIILQFTRQRYENQLKQLQDEAMLKLKALNEKIELNHSSYEGQLNTLNTSNRKLEEEKKVLKESTEEKLRNMKELYHEKMENYKITTEQNIFKMEKEYEVKQEALNTKLLLVDELKKDIQAILYKVSK